MKLLTSFEIGKMRDKLVAIAVFIVLVSLKIQGSEPGKDISEEDIKIETDYNSLFFTFDYSTQTNTFGVINDEVKQPNYSPGISFFSKYNFDVSVLSIFTKNGDTSFTKTSSEIDFSAGYSFQPNENFTIYPSFTHSEYSKSISPLLSAFSDIAQLNLYYNKGVYFGGLSSSVLFGDKNMFHLSMQNALGIYIDDLLFKNSLLSIQLEFDVSFSDKNYYNKLIYDLWNQEEFLFWVYEEYPRTLLAVRARIENYGLDSTKDWFYSGINEIDNSVFGSSYNITSLSFVFPIYYSVGQFMFNFTTFLVVPTSSNSFYQQNTQLLFSTGIAYNLNF